MQISQFSRYFGVKILLTLHLAWIEQYQNLRRKSLENNDFEDWSLHVNEKCANLFMSFFLGFSF